MKLSEKHKKDWTWFPQLTEQMDEKSSDELVKEGVEIFKALLAEKITKRQEEYSNQRKYHSSFIPQVSSFSDCGLSKRSKSRKRRAIMSNLKLKPISEDYVRNDPVINSQKLYKNLMKDWNEVKRCKNNPMPPNQLTRLSDINRCIKQDPLLNKIRQFKPIDQNSFKKEIFETSVYSEQTQIGMKKQKDFERLSRL